MIPGSEAMYNYLRPQCRCRFLTTSVQEQCAECKFHEALELLQLCDSCDLWYSAAEARGLPSTDETMVGDLVRAFLRRHT
jgi:hypothetical protein